jgi:N-carbamoyl-L-amino-acid hydrolase
MTNPENFGDQILAWAEQLAAFSEPDFAAKGQLTVTYLTDAHQQASACLVTLMRQAGFDDVNIDALGNVVGIYRALEAGAKRLLTGSHFDTVRNAGKYDGRLGIFIPIAAVQTLSRAGRRLPFDLEVVGFAEEEGQRYRATFLASGALIGKFDPAWLEQVDSAGITMREAMKVAGLPAEFKAIQALVRTPSDYLGFVEVHIEQGPVLNAAGLPLGVVTSINAGMRGICTVQGVAAHAGTTPMDMRQDALLAAAEIALMAEKRARQDQGSVATVGQMQVPDGSINVIPGACVFSVDLRAPSDAQRDALVSDVLSQAQVIASRRGVTFECKESMRASAAPSDPTMLARWERAVKQIGQPVFKLNSGAGHDAMMLHQVMPQAMLFMRGGNHGISHNPLETISAEDTELATQAFIALLEDFESQRA